MKISSTLSQQSGATTSHKKTGDNYLSVTPTSVFNKTAKANPLIHIESMHSLGVETMSHDASLNESFG